MDIVLFGLVIVAMVVSYIFLFMKKGDTVEVWVHGQKQVYSLNQDKEFETQDGHLTIKIENGTVWVVDADCPDKFCIRRGKISRANQSIACIPNNVVINIKAEGDGDLDIIS